MLNLLDLFSGIGGFSLGLERTGGFRTVAFCEIEPFPRRMLAKHWPGVPCYDDVRTLGAGRLAADGIDVDVICGGFPCQDISLAGAGAGIDGKRSGLWREYARLVDELRPRYVIVENVSALLVRGLDRVLGDLAALGYDAEWHCLPASALGAPHRRDRLWIVAHPHGSRQPQPQRRVEGLGRRLGDGREAVAYPNGVAGDQGRAGDAPEEPRGRDAHRGGFGSHDLGDADGSGLALRQGIRRHHVEECAATVGAGWWAAEPDVGRVAHGVPSRVDRLRALGNAVVPQIPEMIGRAILAAEQHEVAQ